MLAFGIPAGAKGLKFICREPFDDGKQSLWDHPLGARFEEPDAVCVFDDVLIPWDRVFMYGDVKMGNALFAQASIRNSTGHRAAIRGLVKCQFTTGLALTRTVKSDVFLHVQEQLGELLGYLQMIEAAIPMAERGRADRPRRDPSALRPAQAIRYTCPNGTSAWCTSRRSTPGAPITRRKRPPLGDDRPRRRALLAAPVSTPRSASTSSLAWDATQFGQRMLHYERYYAGDPVRLAAACDSMSSRAGAGEARVGVKLG